MRSFDDLLADAVAMHRGCVCPGQVLGVRMAMLGCQLLGIDEPTGARLILPIKLPQNGDTCNLCLTLYDKI